MKEMINSIITSVKKEKGELYEVTLSYIISGFFALLSSRAAIGQVMRPFGISMLAAVPYTYLPAVAIGGFLGYFAAAITGEGFRYTAALLAVLAIRILIAGYKSISKSPLFVCLISLLSLAATAPVVTGRTVISLVAEVFIAAGGAYFFKISLYALSQKKYGFSQNELYCFLITIAIFTAGLGKINISGVFLYRIICLFLIFFTAKYGGAAISTATGISAALCIFMVEKNLPLCVVAVICGLSISIFRVYGKWIIALSGTALCLVGMIIADNTLHITFFIETLIAAALYISLPKGFRIELGKFFCVYPKTLAHSDLKRVLRLKLLDAADALGDVKSTVNEVSERLSVITSPDFSGISKEIENTACDGCKLRIHCWETRKFVTTDTMVNVIEAAKRKEKNPEAFADEKFKAVCLKPNTFFKTTLQIYEKYSKSLAAEKRAKEVREIVSEQYDGISLLLRETADEIGNTERFDKNSAVLAAEALKNLGIYATDAVCRINRLGRHLIKVKATSAADTVINKMQVLRAVSQALELDFSVPLINKNGQDIFITLCEAPRYSVETGMCQISAGGSSMCGDSCKFLNDGNGRFFAILSDGMGTGGAAAVDSALSSGLALRLIKSGIEPESALKIINSSMLFKSTYESTATLDIACIDLFTGKTKLFKAGAAPTLIRHGSRIATAFTRSLPIGIISDVNFEKADITLKNKDIILMMSDGATGESIEWIKRELENSGDISAQSLSESIAYAAKRRRSDGHEDDITVISLIIEPTV